MSQLELGADDADRLLPMLMDSNGKKINHIFVFLVDTFVLLAVLYPLVSKGVSWRFSVFCCSAVGLVTRLTAWWLPLAFAATLCICAEALWRESQRIERERIDRERREREETERASRVFWGGLSTVAAGAFAVAAVVVAAVAESASQSNDNDGQTNHNDRRNGEFLRVYHLMDGNSHPQFKLVRNRIAHGGSAATSEELDRIRRWVA